MWRLQDYSMPKLIDFRKYIEERFKPLTIIGTTSFGPVDRIIWHNTWAQNDPFWWFRWYRSRAMKATHIAVTAIGLDSRKWIFEMDMTKRIVRYVSDDGDIKLPEEYEAMHYDMKLRYREVFIFSGLERHDPSKYYADNIYSAHVCWIGEYTRFDSGNLDDGNEWLFDKYRNGVPYNYADILLHWDFARKIGINVMGSPEIYICSEMPQRLFEHLGVFQISNHVMTPMEWQVSPIIRTIKYDYMV